MTAQRPAAYSHASHDLCLIPDSYLTQLDSGLEDCRKIFHQISEVDPSVGCEIEQNLVVVKGILHIDELHLQIMFFNLFQTDLKGLFFFFLVGGFHCLVFFCRHADHGF